MTEYFTITARIVFYFYFVFSMTEYTKLLMLLDNDYLLLQWLFQQSSRVPSRQ